MINLSRATLHPLFWPLAVLAAGLVVTVALVFQARQWVDEQLAAKLEYETQQIAARMQQQFALQEEILRGLVGLFAASDAVTRQDFRAYVNLLDLRERFPAAIEFRFARHVRAAELATWQQQVARSLAKVSEAPVDVSPKPPGERDAYLLVEFVYPFSPQHLGLDLLADPRRQAALAKLSGGEFFALSERLTEEYPEAAHYALITRLPTRVDNAFPGTVALVFRPDRLVNKLAYSIHELDVELYDQPPTARLGSEIASVFDTHAAVEAPHAGQPLPWQARRPLA
ncbi:MAG: CHASE domain-containing protein, partial [Rhodocyclaceae bacterium]|nr:CHASE domain-containing protein [Rhodocyclaceae bacterium]